MGSRDLQLLTDEIYSIKDSFESMLSEPSIKFEREAEFAIQILAGNDYLLKLAKTPEGKGSLLAAVHNVAGVGISLNPAKKQGYLVPRKGKICLDISYMGLIDIAVSAGAVRWAQAHLVYENDHFEVCGIDVPPEHKFKPFAKDRGDVVGAYCVAKFPDGDYITEAMSLDQINDIRDRSEAWKAYQAKGVKCPWVTDPGEMSRKTVVKRASKYWADADKSGRVAAAVHHLNVEGGEGLAELAAQREMADAHRAPAAPPAAPDLEAQAKAAAAKGVKAYSTFWGSITKADRYSLASHHEERKAIAARVDTARTVDMPPPPDHDDVPPTDDVPPGDPS